MPTMFLPYIGSMRNVFLHEGEQYTGNGDVAFNAGFVNAGDLSCAKHGVYYAWSPYRDAWRRSTNPIRMQKAAKNSREIQNGIHLSEQALVIDNIREASAFGDYCNLVTIVDSAMKEWGILDRSAGYVDGKLISDTKELILDPQNAQFQIHTDYCAFFSGAPDAEIKLDHRIRAKIKNDRISVSLMAADQGKLCDTKIYLLTAMGRTGMDGTQFTPGPQYMGIPVTIVTMAGKLYVETLEGELLVSASAATLELLDPTGKILVTLKGEPCADGVRFQLDGTVPAVQYRLLLK